MVTKMIEGCLKYSTTRGAIILKGLAKVFVVVNTLLLSRGGNNKQFEKYESWKQELINSLISTIQRATVTFSLIQRQSTAVKQNRETIMTPNRNILKQFFIENLASQSLMLTAEHISAIPNIAKLMQTFPGKYLIKKPNRQYAKEEMAQKPITPIKFFR